MTPIISFLLYSFRILRSAILEIPPETIISTFTSPMNLRIFSKPGPWRVPSREIAVLYVEAHDYLLFIFINCLFEELRILACFRSQNGVGRAGPDNRLKVGFRSYPPSGLDQDIERRGDLSYPVKILKFTLKRAIEVYEMEPLCALTLPSQGHFDGIRRIDRLPGEIAPKQPYYITAS